MNQVQKSVCDVYQRNTTSSSQCLNTLSAVMTKGKVGMSKKFISVSTNVFHHILPITLNYCVCV